MTILFDCEMFRRYLRSKTQEILEHGNQISSWSICECISTDLPFTCAQTEIFNIERNQGNTYEETENYKCNIRNKSSLENESFRKNFFNLGECCRMWKERAHNFEIQIESLSAALKQRKEENDMLKHDMDKMINESMSKNDDICMRKYEQTNHYQREYDIQEFERQKSHLEEELRICKHQSETEKEEYLREINSLQNELQSLRCQVEIHKETPKSRRDETIQQISAFEKQINEAEMQAAKYASEVNYMYDLDQKRMQVQASEEEISRLKSEINRLQSELHMWKCQAETQNETLKSERDHAVDQKRIQEQKSEREISKLERERDDALNDILAYKEQMKESGFEISELRRERDSARQEVQEYKKQVDNANIQISILRESENTSKDQNSKVTLENEGRIKKLVAEIQTLKSEQDRLQKLNRKVTEDNNRFKCQVNELSKAKDDALTRLSKVAGAKLTQGNAAITDLSDDNRPTKISEKFSEVYDNAWTDAFEDIEGLGIDEREGIDILLAILKKTFELCSKVEEKYEAKILQAVTTIPSVFQSEGLKDYTVQTNIQVIKSLCEIRLSMENVCSNAVEQMILSYLPNFLKTLSTKFDVNNTPSKLVLYTRSCTRLCWLMRVRDPPLHLQFDIQSDGVFSQDYFRQYTKSGKNVDYMVWPVLFLHKNGPLLAKGVAQPK